MRDGVPRALLGAGWVLAIAALASAFTAWQRVSSWTADPLAAPDDSQVPKAAAAAPWLLIGALTLTGASLLTAL